MGAGIKLGQCLRPFANHVPGVSYLLDFFKEAQRSKYPHSAARRGPPSWESSEGLAEPTGPVAVTRTKVQGEGEPGGPKSGIRKVQGPGAAICKTAQALVS